MVLLGTAALAQSQNPNPTQLIKSPPNEQLAVQRKSGTCPKQVGLWTGFRYYEGGGELTVVADTATIAGPARLSASNETMAEYVAPLKRAHASCVGRTIPGEQSAYSMRFAQGRVYFRVDVTEIAKNPSTPAGITHKSLVGTRPYVRWAIAD